MKPKDGANWVTTAGHRSVVGLVAGAIYRLGCCWSFLCRCRCVVGFIAGHSAWLNTGEIHHGGLGIYQDRHCVVYSWALNDFVRSSIWGF